MARPAFHETWCSACNGKTEHFTSARVTKCNRCGKTKTEPPRPAEPVPAKKPSGTKGRPITIRPEMKNPKAPAKKLVNGALAKAKDRRERRTARLNRKTEDAIDMEIAEKRLAEIEQDPSRLIRGEELDRRLAKLDAPAIPKIPEVFSPSKDRCPRCGEDGFAVTVRAPLEDDPEREMIMGLCDSCGQVDTKQRRAG